MTVFFSPFSDSLLCILCIALLWTGLNCAALARVKDVARPVAAWRWLGIALLILAAREWIGIIGVSDNGFANWYPAVGAMQLAAALFVLLAAYGEFASGSKTALLVRVLAVILTVTLAGLAALPFLGISGGIEAEADFPALFFSTKIALCAAAGLLLLRSLPHAKKLSAGFRLVPVLFFLHTVVIMLCDPVGTPAGPEEFDPAANDAMLAIWIFHVCLSLVMAVHTWALHTDALGVSGRIRWWPAMLLGLLMAMGAAFIIESSLSYSGIIRRNLAATAENAAAAMSHNALNAAAAKNETENTVTADWLFGHVRDMAGFQSYSPVRVHIDALGFLPGTNAPVPVIDRKSDPEGGAWAASFRSFDAVREKIRQSAGGFIAEEGSGLYNLAPVVAFAPVTAGDGSVAGAAVLSVDTLELVRDLYLYKRSLLLLLPLAFLLCLLMIAGQQRSWLASHSSSRAAALRQGALSNDLAGVMLTTGASLHSRVLDANQRFLDMIGRTRGELIGRRAGTAFTLVMTDDGDPDEDDTRAIPSSTFEMSFRQKNGETVHLMVFGRPLSVNSDDRTHVWEAIDVTRTREMEKEVRHTNERLQMILDTMPGAVFIKNPAGRYLMANKAFNTLFCVPEGGTIAGRTLEELSGGDNPNRSLNDDICRDMRGKTLVYDQELTFGNVTKFFEISKTVRYINEGGDGPDDFIVIGSVHDLTVRKRAENAIDAERHFLHQVLSALPVAVCFVDRERKVRICDIDFAREAGCADAEDLIGKSLDEVTPFGVSDRVEDERLLAAGEGRNDTTFDLPAADGRQARNFMLRRTVMSSPEGEVLGLVKAYWDTTALVSANRAAQQAERAKMAFLANMSHELRTPMNGIVGMADLIIDHPATEPMQRLHAETIIRSAKTLQMVMDEVMDVATLTDGAQRFAVNPAPFPLLYLAEEAVQIVSCIIEAWGVELSLNYDFNLQTMYNADARHIRQIMVQILTHTSRLTRDRKLRLEIAGVGSLDDERIALRVIFKPTDDIDTQRLDDMFKQPARTSEETRSAIDLGIFNDRIGLPLTWRLIEAMGGSLSVTRQFRDIRCEVVLPMSTRDPGSHPVTAPDLSGAGVLIGTNAPERALIMKKCFDYARCAEVQLAENVEAVRARLREAQEKNLKFDLVVLDGGLVHPDHIADFVGEAGAFLDQEPGGPNIMLLVTPRQVQNLQLEPSAAKCLLLPPVCPSELWYKADTLLSATATADTPKTRRRSTRVERIVRIPANVLLVEDNSVNQMVAMGILKRIGCQPTLAKDGSEAVDMIVKQGLVFDIILMDCMMPVMDGYEATTRIRIFERSGAGAKRNIIVALTANTLAGDRERCLASGMDDYMTKPITLDQVRDSLMKHCAKLVTMVDTAREAEEAAG